MLDIIIPAYKDSEGLRKTLKSVYYPEQSDWVTITVIDDCSPIGYNEVLEEFPTVNYIRLTTNRGPGFARQYGINNCSEPYFMFVDCGDVLISKYSVCEIRDLIEKFPDYLLFLFTWINERTERVSTRRMRSTQGWVYNRKLFQLYDIQFCTDERGGRADEDVGLNHICTTIINYLETENNKQYSAFSTVPIYKKIHNNESITATGHYSWEKHIPGLAINATHCIRTLERNNISEDMIIDELNVLMISLYKSLLEYAREDSNLLEEHWEIIRKFYKKVYQPYEQKTMNENYLTQNTRRFLNSLKKLNATPNVKRFLKELDENEFCPLEYYDMNKN